MAEGLHELSGHPSMGPGTGTAPETQDDSVSVIREAFVLSTALPWALHHRSLCTP